MNKKLKNKLKNKIRVIPDFPKKGIQFQDITSITDNKQLFIEVVNEISRYCKKNNFTKVAGIEARGFIFGSAISLQASKPMLVARKPGKLPGELIEENYFLEYGQSSLSVQKDSLMKFSSYAIVDDLLATGGTIDCVANLVRKNDKKVSGAVTVVELKELKGRSRLDFPVESMMSY